MRLSRVGNVNMMSNIKETELFVIPEKENSQIVCNSNKSRIIDNIHALAMVNNFKVFFFSFLLYRLGS